MKLSFRLQDFIHFEVQVLWRGCQRTAWLCLGSLLVRKPFETGYYEKSGLINVTFEICLSLLTLSHLSPKHVVLFRSVQSLSPV